MNIALLLSQPIHAAPAATGDASSALVQSPPPPVPVALAKAAPVVKKKRIRKNRKLTVKQLQSKRENESSDSRVYNLTLDINALKQQVRDYMVYKTLRETRMFVDRLNYNAGVLRTTQHHFDLFQSGIRPWTPDEAAFFRATIGDEIIVSEKPGTLESVFAAWCMYRDVMQLRRFTVERMRVAVSDDEACIIECECEVEGLMTRELIDAFFPHVLANRALLHKILNARLVYPTKTVVHFDTAGRMIQYNGSADFFEGFSRIPTLTPTDVLEIMSASVFGTHSCLNASMDDEWVEMLDEAGATVATSGESEQEADAVSVTSSNSAAASPAPTLGSISDSSSPVRSSVEYILS